MNKTGWFAVITGIGVVWGAAQFSLAAGDNPVSERSMLPNHEQHHSAATGMSKMMGTLMDTASMSEMMKQMESPEGRQMKEDCLKQMDEVQQ